MSNYYLPHDWQEVKLGSLGTFLRGHGGTRADEIANGLPCIRYGDLYTHHNFIVRTFCSAINPSSAHLYSSIKTGDIIFAGSGETFEEIGKAAAYCGNEQAYAGADTIIFRPGESLDSYFAGYAVNDCFAIKHKSRLGQGSSVIHISANHLASIPLRIPPIHQQQRIAKILQTIDRTITHMEALIEKYQQIKAGLTHDLFTRGIGADGKLRLSHDKAPELYQESSIGWIPKEWKLSILRDYLIDNPTNGIYKSPDQIGDGTLMIGQTAFTKDRSIDFHLCRRGLISEAEERKYNVSENNILITRVFATVDGVGLPTLVPQMHEKAVFESNMMRLRIDDSKIAPLILFEWLRGSKVRKLIVSGANASNQVSVNQKTLNILPVPLIGGDEQSRIVDSISTHNRRYLIEKMYLDKLKKQKSGLMHDLLTGTVRVNSDPV